MLVGWQFLQEQIILYFTQVPIVVEDFETNFIESVEDAEFDWDLVGQLEAFDWLNYVGISEEVSPVGELIVPVLDIRVPIFLGVGEPNISIGAGTMMRNIVMGEGNYSLASHWDPNPGIRFGGIDQIQIGDVLILRDAHYLYIYETIIGDNYIIENYRTDIVDEIEGKAVLTLMTCTPDGSQRVMVRGELVEQISVDELRDMIARADEIHYLAGLPPTINIEEIVEVVERLEYPDIPIPFVEIGILVGVPFLLATFIVWISSLGTQKKKK